LTQSPTQPPTPAEITGVILAGGKARRLNGRDKGLEPFSGRPLVEWVVAALAPQVGGLVINANRNQETYGRLGYPVIADQLDDFQGPLAGFASAMAAASTPWILTVPCDGPFLAPDLAARLVAALKRDDAELAVASDGRRMQPVHALLPVSLAPSLAAFLAEGERKIDHWYARHRVALADLSDRPESFANLNTEADAAELARGLAP
jgi:molybdopterin-guanine dinucleotide biosynthesis protein A